jgi:uncharacterized protein (DUF433 family)
MELSSDRTKLADRIGVSTIKRTPGVSGGATCIRDTRIPVWTLVRLQQLGRTQEQLLADFPGLTSADLTVAWDCHHVHHDEIKRAIADEEQEE